MNKCEVCEVGCTSMCKSTRLKPSESKCKTSYKSLKNYSWKIAQLTFSFCSHKWNSYFYNNFPLFPLIILHLLQRSEENAEYLTLYKIRILTGVQKYPDLRPLIRFSASISSLFCADLIYEGDWPKDLGMD